MKIYKTLMAILSMLTLTILLSACTVVRVHEHEYEDHEDEDEHEHNGPPPHAPAHGYRYKYHNNDLEYDSDLGIYVVIGLPNIYFIDGIYYKRTKYGWYSSPDADKGWKEYKKYNLPGKLNRKYGHEKGHGKHEHDD